MTYDDIVGWLIDRGGLSMGCEPEAGRPSAIDGNLTFHIKPYSYWAMLTPKASVDGPPVLVANLKSQDVAIKALYAKAIFDGRWNE